MPFSVDDGAGYLSPCPPNGSSFASTTPPSPAPLATSPEPLRAGLGPLLPLPLILQRGNTSTIVEQPTDLRLLTSRLLDHATTFVKAHRGERWFIYFAFGHVHTATAAISPDRQYAGCRFAGTTARPFTDALAEVDDAVGSLLGVIDELGQASSTLTLFTSDNGPSLRWKGGAGTVGPFVGAAAAFANGTSYRNTAKGSTWEGGIRMPAFVHWPGTVTPGGAADTVISTLDVLPSLLRVLQRPMPTGRTLDGTLSLADVILSSSSGGGRRARHGADPPTRHAFLPFYNEPSYGNASHRIFAARYGRYKAHWITSPGLGGGLLPYTSPTPEATHSPPLVFDVEADPEEAFPLPPASLPPALLAELAKRKAAYESQLTPTAITSKWGYEYALCCGVGCTPPCVCQCKGVPLPP